MAAKKRQSRNHRNTKANSRRKSAANWLRTPITIPKGRPLRIVIFARYSSDEQNPRSIDDQVAYCRSFLESLDIQNASIDVITDEGISGEIVSRPGIEEVYAGCCDRRWDLLLCEDASRLYRHETACAELIETAVDEGIRCICINDLIDTAEEDWEDRLHEAMRHHAKCNRYTSRRIQTDALPLCGKWERPWECLNPVISANRPFRPPNVNRQKDRFTMRSIRDGHRSFTRPMCESPQRNPPHRSAAG